MMLGPIDWLIVAAYMVVCVAAGMWMRRYIRGVDDFAVAGREMDINLGIASLAATEMGIVTVMYTAEMGFTSGFAGATPGVLIAAAMLAVGLTGFVIAPLRRTDVITIPELFEKRFGKHVRWLAGLVVVLGGVLNMGIFLRVGGEFLVHVTGLPKEYLEITMTSLLAIVLLYTVLGGMLSVLVTDYIQFLVMGLGIVVTSVLVVNSIGWTELTSELTEAHAISVTANAARKAAEEADDAASLLVANADDPPATAASDVDTESMPVGTAKNVAISAADEAQRSAKEAMDAADTAKAAAARSLAGNEAVGIRATQAKKAAEEINAAARTASLQAERTKDLAARAAAAARQARTAFEVAEHWGDQESDVDAAREAATAADTASQAATKARQEALAAAAYLAEKAKEAAVQAKGSAKDAFEARHEAARLAVTAASGATSAAGTALAAAKRQNSQSEGDTEIARDTRMAAERARIAAKNVNGCTGGLEIADPVNPLAATGVGWEWVIWQAILAVAVVTTWQTNIARVLSAKDDKTARKVYRRTAFYFVGRFGLPGLWGAAAFYYFWQRGGLPEGVDSLTAMPVYLNTLLPAGVIGLMIAAMLAAEMSTDSGYLLTWATVIYNDIVMPLVKTPPSAKVKLLVVRSLVVLIGIFLVFYGLWYEMPGRAWDYLAVTGNIYLASVFSLLVGALYWKKANSWGAIASLVLGAVGPITFLIYNGIVKDPAQQIKPEWAGLSAFALAFAGMIVGTYVARFFGAGVAGPIPGLISKKEIEQS